MLKQNETYQFNTSRKKEAASLKRQNSNFNSSQPQYAEIYSPNHYASTGLFIDNNTNNTNTTTTTSSSNNLDHSNTNTNSTFVLNSTDKKYKTIFGTTKLINPLIIKVSYYFY